MAMLLLKKNRSKTQNTLKMKNRIKMNKLKLITAAILCIALSGAQAQTEGEIIVPISNPANRASIEVDIKKGSITVRGTSRKDVKVVYKGRDNEKNKNNEEKNGLKKIASAGLDLEVYERDNKISISSDSWNKGIDLVIEIPLNSDLSVDTYNSGDILVENVTGEVIAENYNGKITLMNISGSTVASTYNGTIKVLLDKVTADTPMSFTTYNGDVDITMPSVTKGNLKLKSVGGDIYSGFDMKVLEAEAIQKKSENKDVYRVYLDDWTKATINGGGPDITMKNHNGDIYIRTK